MVAELRSPVTLQAIARATRPPSIGNAGRRLKTSSSRLIEASQAAIASTPSAPELDSISADWRNSCQPPARMPPIVSAAKIAAVTAGPASATRASTPGPSASRSIRAMPPKIQSWIELIPIPLRRATQACPSSCRRIEPKKPAALATARANGVVELLELPNSSL